MQRFGLIVLLLTVCCLIRSVQSVDPWDLPILPEGQDNDDYFKSKTQFEIPTSSGNGIKKFIPPNVYFAIRNLSHDRPHHHKAFAQRNSNWNIDYYDNNLKDKWMNDNFANTKLLWVYNLLNPEIGASKPNIWRLAMLWKKGGFYMDDDADIATPLDDIIKTDDKILLAEDSSGNWDDRCWLNKYPLSNSSMVQRFDSGDSSSNGGVSMKHNTLFHGKWFINWAIFSSPGHPILRRMLHHMVTLIESEYNQLGTIKMNPTDHKAKVMRCATTFPLTLVAREIVLEWEYKGTTSNGPSGPSIYKDGQTDTNTYQIDLGARGFDANDYGGNIKAWNNDAAPDRWIKMIHNKGKPYLIQYSKPNPIKSVVTYNGWLLQANHGKEIWLCLNGKKHSFTLKVFMECGYDFEEVHLINSNTLDAIPVGEPVYAYDNVKDSNGNKINSIYSKAVIGNKDTAAMH
jgi:hypothetical protein